MRKTRRRALLLIAILLAAAVAFALKGREGMVDFQVNYEAAHRLRAGETLYRAGDGHYQFKYPPFSAFLYVPVSFLPVGTAKGIWFILVLASSVLAFAVSRALVRREGGNSGLWIDLLPVLFLARFYLREIQLGQINALITVLMLLMVCLLVRRAPGTAGTWSDYGAGAIWGLSTALKPYAAIFLPYWVLRGKWKTMLGGGFAVAAAFLGPALYYGMSGNILVHREWIRTLSRSTPLLFGTQDNVSLIAFFSKWLGAPGAARIVYLFFIAALAILTAVLILRGRRLPRAVVLDAGLLMTLIPLVSPLGWDYTLLSSVLAFMLVLSRLDAFPSAARAVFVVNGLVLGLSLYDLMGRATYAKFMALSIPTLNALVLVAFLAWLRLKERA
jgi:alpha-1,2-mannosyltransferase